MKLSYNRKEMDKFCKQYNIPSLPVFVVKEKDYKKALFDLATSDVRYMKGIVGDNSLIVNGCFVIGYNLDTTHIRIRLQDAKNMNKSLLHELCHVIQYKNNNYNLERWSKVNTENNYLDRDIEVEAREFATNNFRKWKFFK